MYAITPIQSMAESAIIERAVVFQNGAQNLVGIVTYPAIIHEPRPAIILLHGFHGQKNERGVTGTDEGTFERAAKRLSAAGYVTLRFDFRGSGESDGDWEDTTFSGQISDTLAAIDFVADQESVDPARIGLLGVSQGGLIAACTAHLDDRVKVVVLWAPVADPAFTYTTILGWDNVQTALDKGAVTFPLPWCGNCTLKKAFFDDLLAVFPLVEIAKFNGPLLVIVGKNDEFVKPQPQEGEAFILSHDGREKLLVIDADHTFDVGEGANDLDVAIASSVQWFDENL